MDKSFTDNLHNIVLNHIADENFGASNLASLLGLSLSQTFSKPYALTPSGYKAKGSSLTKFDSREIPIDQENDSEPRPLFSLPSVERNRSLAINFSLYKLLSFFLVFFIQLSIQAQTRIEIPKDSNWIRTLIDELEVMSDEQHQWSAESLFATSDNLFEPNKVDTKPVLHNYWARFVLANTTENEQWLSFESYYWDYVTLYFRDSTGNVTVIPFGILSNPNNHKFLVRSQTEYDVLANFESSGQFRREDNINLVIKPTLPALEIKTLTNYLDGITFGIMFSLALYNLFLFISLRDRTYFWYSLYILSFAFSFMTLFASEPPKWTQFIITDYPLFAFYIKKIADPLIWISYTNFVRYFLTTKDRHPVWDKALKICIVLIILQFLINLTGIYHFSGVLRVMIWNIVVVVCFVLAIISYFGGHTRARFFILGQFFLLAGLIITFMHYAGWDALVFLPKTAFFNYFRTPSSVFVFGAIESIVFSFALVDKYNMMQKDITRVKIEKEKEKSEALRLQELDIFKTRFYSNITHEFRTPLTVIQGLAESVKSDIKKNVLNDVEKSLTLISRNGQKLLQLINEMLDLAKLESGSMDLQLHQTDIIPFVKYLSESFHSLAKKKEINLVVYSEIDALLMDFDPNKVASIISNLLSNAIKFTSDNGKIIVHLSETIQNSKKYFVVKVKDNGVGIPNNVIANIFNRFYQVDTSSSRKHEGTGVGLALAKELVVLMKGTLHVESLLDRGTTFILQLPVTNEARQIKDVEIDMKQLVNLSSEDALLVRSQQNNSISKLPLALIIEDNFDVAYYIETCLAEKYETLHAKNGHIGIEMAYKNIPDIIISDVMMPEKDGFEVCETLKRDQRTSHIPIILLTAKASEEDKIEGLKHGADAYLIKPFNKAELFIRLEKLIMLRKSLIQKYSDSTYKSLKTTTTNDLEVQFLNKVIACIEKNMENSNFKIVFLARELGLSESQLYRKIKALTNTSTGIFIRSVRLQKAKELLQNKEFNISEICYKVGFTDPSYFSRVFKDEFGCAPSEI